MIGINYLILINKFWFSLWQSCLVVIISLLAGGGLAWLENKFKIQPNKFFNGLMTLPIFLPGLIIATSFIMLYGNNGLWNNFLALLHLPTMKILYSPVAIIMAHGYYNIPLAYLALQARFASAHPYLEEAGAVAGGSGWQIFFHLTWPRLKNTVIGAALLIFLYCFLSFSVPLILGGMKYQTLEVYIYSLITQQLNFSGALFVALLQSLFLIIFIVFFYKYLKNIHEPHLQIIAHKKNNIIIIFMRLTLAAYILVPLLLIISKGMVYNNFIKLIHLGYLTAAARSLWLTVISLIVAFIMIMIILNKKNMGKFFIFFLTLSPVTTGLIFLLLFGKSYLAILLAYLILILPLAYYLIQAAWEARPKFFTETVCVLGASPWQQAQAQIKYLLPTIIKAAALSSALILGDIAIISLLGPYLQPTAMSLSYSLMGSYRFTLATTGLALLLLIIFLIIIIWLWLAKHYDPANKKSFCSN